MQQSSLLRQPQWKECTAIEPYDEFLHSRGGMVSLAVQVDNRVQLERAGVCVQEAMDPHGTTRRLAINPNVPSVLHADVHTARPSAQEGVYSTLYKHDPSFINQVAGMFNHAQMGFALPVQGLNIVFSPESAVVDRPDVFCNSNVESELVVVALNSPITEKWARERGAPLVVFNGTAFTYTNTSFMWKEGSAVSNQAREAHTNRKNKIQEFITDKHVIVNVQWNLWFNLFSLAEHLLLLFQDAILSRQESRLFVVPVNEHNRRLCVLLSIVIGLTSRTYHSTGNKGRGKAPVHSIGAATCMTNGFWTAMHQYTSVKHPFSEEGCTSLSPNDLTALQCNMRAMVNRNHSGFEIQGKAKRQRTFHDTLCFCKTMSMDRRNREFGLFFPGFRTMHIPPREREVLDLTRDDDSEAFVFRIKEEEEKAPALPSLGASEGGWIFEEAAPWTPNFLDASFNVPDSPSGFLDTFFGEPSGIPPPVSPAAAASSSRPLPAPVALAVVEAAPAPAAAPVAAAPAPAPAVEALLVPAPLPAPADAVVAAAPAAVAPVVFPKRKADSFTESPKRPRVLAPRNLMASLASSFEQYESTKADAQAAKAALEKLEQETAQMHLSTIEMYKQIGEALGVNN